MTGKEWLTNERNFFVGLKLLENKLENAFHIGGRAAMKPDNPLYDLKEKALSALYIPYQKAFNRANELIKNARGLPNIDPNFGRVQAGINRLEAKLSAPFYTGSESRPPKIYTYGIIVTGSILSSIYQRKKVRDESFENRILQFFTDRLEEIAADTENVWDDLIKFLRQYMPWIIGIGVGVIVINVVSWIPRKK